MIQFNPPRKAKNVYSNMWAEAGEEVWVHGISAERVFRDDGAILINEVAILENKHGQTWVAEFVDFYFIYKLPKNEAR